MLSLSEIVRKAQSIEDEDQKVEWLKKNDSTPLRQILICLYDTDRLSFWCPRTASYTPSVHLDSQGMLYRQVRKLQYIIEGEQEMNISQYKREWIFIEMLESVDAEDALLLIDVLKQKPLTGLSVNVINKAFGEIIPKKFETTEEVAPKVETKTLSRRQLKSKKVEEKNVPQVS